MRIAGAHPISIIPRSIHLFLFALKLLAMMVMLLLNRLVGDEDWQPSALAWVEPSTLKLLFDSGLLVLEACRVVIHLRVLLRRNQFTTYFEILPAPRRVARWR